MGSWFSNLHIRKKEKITVDSVADYICKIITSQQYTLTSSENEADGAFAIVSNMESQWYSVYSDLFSFEDPKVFTDYAAPMSAEFETDILGISCFDSDFLYLNLINSKSNVDAWLGIGSAAGLGIRKRTNLSAWKNIVDDFTSFKENAKKKYTFAEDILADVEHCIHLPQEYSTASYEYLAELAPGEAATYLYFKLPETTKTHDVPKLVPHTASLMPCFLDNPSTVSGINVGGASKGLSVYFIGSYVEHDEITFSDVYFVKWKNHQPFSIPIELKKVQLPDGHWAYYYHDPGYKIPSKVDDRLPILKRTRIENEHQICVHFVPHGNPRKVLDIIVILVPDKNPQGQMGWNVWHQFGSKKAYIQFYNNLWSKRPGCDHLLLQEEDFD